MGVSDLRVNPQDLLKVSNQLANQAWSTYDNPPSPADLLSVANDAASNLEQNAQALQKFQDVAEAQAKYLSETFHNVATAYQRVDDNSATKIASSERTTAVDAIPVPAASAQLPPIPDGPSLTALSAGGYSSVEQTQAALQGGDDGASLRAAASDYRMRGQLVGSHADEKYSTDWEGDAAEAAYARLNEYSEWLRDLQSAWGRLEAAATQLAEAHDTAAKNHSLVFTAYILLGQEIQRLAAQHDPKNDAKISELNAGRAELIKKSEEIREDYAQGATFDAAKPSEPPFGSRGGGGSTGGGGNGGASGAGGGSGGSGGSTGGASGASGATMPDSAGIQSAAQTAGSGETGGSGSGGESSGGGGSQSGGGSPSGAGEGGTGGLPGGLPDGDTGMPALPDDPSLHPASAAGGGGSGGGGGGGLGPSPLQPNLGGSAVGTSPAGVGPGVAGGPGGAAATGGMGGMGGGMPMHGAGHGQGGGTEKKRNPGLSPDENIYTEEREWTEPVIGQRRRTVADTSKDSK